MPATHQRKPQLKFYVYGSESPAPPAPSAPSAPIQPSAGKPLLSERSFRCLCASLKRRTKTFHTLFCFPVFAAFFIRAFRRASLRQLVLHILSYCHSAESWGMAAAFALQLFCSHNFYTVYFLFSLQVCMTGSLEVQSTIMYLLPNALLYQIS